MDGGLHGVAAGAEDADVLGLRAALVAQHGFGQIPARDLDHMFPVQGAAAGLGLGRHLGGAGERRARGPGRGEAPGTALHELAPGPSRRAAPPRA